MPDLHSQVWHMLVVFVRICDAYSRDALARHGPADTELCGTARHVCARHVWVWHGTARPILVCDGLARHGTAWHWHGTAVARPIWHGTAWHVLVACLGLPCCMAPPHKGHSTFARYFTNRSHGEMKSDHQVDWLTSTLGSSRMSLSLSLTLSCSYLSAPLSLYLALAHT